VKNLIPIGRFAALCRLSVKALRHYDELGLLRPAAVDPASGYRYYSLAQAAEAEKIRALRALEMPLEEIRAVLLDPDPASARARLERHRDYIEQRIAEYSALLGDITALIERPAPADYTVVARELTPQPVLGLRLRTPFAAMGEAMARGYCDLYGHLAARGASPAGPPLRLFWMTGLDEPGVDLAARDEELDLELCVPVAGRVASAGALIYRELPGGPAASTLHAGPYASLGDAYRAVFAWMEERGLEPGIPARDAFLVGVPQTSDASRLRTEVICPIRS
jgi:DNA-binding transcriptional MerR regulator/effector-binding domain-containing protein